MPPSLDRREFLRRAGLAGASGVLLAGLPRPPAVADEALAPFLHGVASGDPAADSVVIWTRLTTTTAIAAVDWVVARDLELTDVVASGTEAASGDRDHTVKVVVGGLEPGSWYFFGFSEQATGRPSIIGRTKTAPAAGVDHLRFAVTSCSSYQHGLFNVYAAIAQRDDLDAVIHCGDYFYEYQLPSRGGYGSEAAEQQLGRGHQPPHEVLSLGDYRTRHAQYKLDPDLRRLHQLFPFITTWDDHESANNSWREGAENHGGGEGPWAARKAAAMQAYAEWLPVRESWLTTAEVYAGMDVDPGTLPDRHLQLWRQVRYGDLVDILVLDTRLERDQEVGQIGFTLPFDEIDDPDRVMLSIAQREWLLDRLGRSVADGVQWRVLAQQVILSPWQAGGLPQLLPFLAEQGGFDRPNLLIRDEGNALNPDQWDGYTAERRRLLDRIRELGGPEVNLVVLTGDVHTSWAIDVTDDPHNPLVYNPVTGDGAVGVEFVATSVTSPTLIGSLGEVTPLGELPPEAAALAPAVEQANMAANPHVKFFDSTQHGYFVLDITPERTQADFFFVDTILSPDYTETPAASWKADDGAGHLSPADALAAAGAAPPGTPSASLSAGGGTGGAARGGGEVIPATGGAAWPPGALAAAAAGAGLVGLRRRVGRGAVPEEPGEASP